MFIFHQGHITKSADLYTYNYLHKDLMKAGLDITQTRTMLNLTLFS